MSEAPLTPKAALRYVYEEPSSRSATPAKLREAARGWEKEAFRQERLAQGTRSKRRNVKLLREASQHRGNAKLVRLAAEEIERVGAETVAEAHRSWFQRICARFASAFSGQRSAA